jgi:cation-transporting P-type ATPase E
VSSESAHLPVSSPPVKESPPGAASRTEGLSSEEVRARVLRGDLNRRPASPGRTLGDILRANVLTRFNAILGSLFVIVVIVGPVQDALFGIILVVNTAIGVGQELRAKRSLDRLAILTAPRAHVVREGAASDISVEEIVVDDLLQLRPGDQVVVDGDVLRSDGLEVDESLLSGEIEPVTKNQGDRVLSGSFVTAGTASVRATEVGASSYASSLESEARRFTLIRSELQSGTNQILRLVTWIMIPTGLALVVTQLAHRHRDSLADAIRGSVAGVAAMVPEGLVLLTSIAFAVGAMRLARHQVLVQELAAVEGLARVDVLCIDKTGTLTTPGMQRESIELLSDPGEDVEEVLTAVAAADPAPNATIRALLEVGRPRPSWGLQHRIPFSSSRKWSAASFDAHGNWVLGAPDVIAPEDDTVSARVASQPAAARVLLLARTEQPIDGMTLSNRLTPVALVVLSEQLRPDARETVRYLTAQGVTIKVLSGDAPETVRVVARRAGVPSEGGATDAAGLDDAAFARTLEETTVFGRVRPEQKLEAVRALQSRGHVVAMVGDGINDVQALKQADLGIAMGSGSQSSRAVARVVLLDSGFSAVPQILAEGRRVIANVERVANLFVAKTAYATLLAIAVVVSTAPYPFFPRHLTIVSTLTIGIPGFFLALAPGAPLARSGFTRRVLAFAVPAGTAAAVATFATYAIARATPSTTLLEARTAAMLGLFGVGIWVLVLVAKPLDRWKLVLVTLLAAAVVVPFASSSLRQVFALEIPPASVLLTTAMCVAVAIGGLTLYRRLVRP